MTVPSGNVGGGWLVPWFARFLCLCLVAACQSPTAELSGLAQRAPLDYSVLVTGGAFLQRAPFGAGGTFATGAEEDGGTTEPVRVADVLAVLRQGAVFHRVEVDDDAHRETVRRQLLSRGADPGLLDFLQSARDSGFDLLLVVEELQDNPIDAQGINGRWPVTLVTWLLLGVGMFIPDHTFESGVTLRVTVRDLQTGAVMTDSISSAGPIDLSLVERSDTLGVVTSILVPPFWVGSDDDRVARAVRDVTQRRLLLSLARELKSEPTRQRLRERAVAAITLQRDRVLTVDADESLTAVRLRPLSGQGAVDPAVAARFEQRLLATMQRAGERYVYEAPLPDGFDRGSVQVLVSTIAGSVASGTFVIAEAP
ncbi:MAG: hypothetical protein ABL997_12360 [Planctomycetota bacterium]